MHTIDFRANLWSSTAIPAPQTPPQEGEEKTDVAVIGAGFTGLSAALHLAQKGVSVTVLEAAEPGFGASGRNNGQVIPAYSRHTPEEIVQTFGSERGERLNQWVAGSADLVFRLIREHDIDCDAFTGGWLQPAHAPARLKAARIKHDQWAARQAPVAMLSGEETIELTGSPVYRHGGWMHRGGGHIQPLSYARGLAAAALAAGARIHGASPARALERAGAGWRITLPRGTLTADQVIIATNAYTDDLWPKLKRTIVPLRSFHSATAPLSDDEAASVLPQGHGLSDTREALWAFRKDRMNRIVTTAAPLFTLGAKTAITRDIVRRYRTAFPQIRDPRLEYIWQGQIAMTPERLPRFHELAGGVIAGLGYSGRGIAIGTAMGAQLAQKVTGTPSADLAVPDSDLKPLPMHGLVVPMTRALIPFFRWRDRNA
jgi:glycine/D-amino acid oxidase-like deaminating enzyme